MKKQTIKQTTERKISASLRIALVLFLLALNIASVVILAYFLQSHAFIFFALLELVAIGVAVNIQSSASSGSYKLAWTMLVVALPVAGMVLYVLWGGNVQSKKLNLLPLPPPDSRSMELRQSNASQERLGRELPNWQRASRLLSRRDFLVYRDTAAVYFPTGADFFEDAIRRMEKAERFIFLEYFILAEGRLWDRMQAVLTDRARRGVEIKIIFDDFGNITRMRGETIEAIRAEGMEVCVFNPVHQYVNRLYFNYRDHRKILCIDGDFAYTGGINIADEYANKVVRFGHWKDTHMRFTGGAVWSFSVMFLSFWSILAVERPDYYKYLSAQSDPNAIGYVQPLSSGPGRDDHLIESAFINLISTAKRYVYITTPYLILDNEIQTALINAALAGVDVRIIIPRVPDKKMVYFTTKSFVPILIKAGVKVYTYSPGFIHAKMMIVDDERAFIGTCNMDYRSFYLHYEDGALLYNVDSIADMKADFIATQGVSKQMTHEEVNDVTLATRFMRSVLRLIAPMM